GVGRRARVRPRLRRWRPPRGQGVDAATPKKSWIAPQEVPPVPDTARPGAGAPGAAGPGDPGRSAAAPARRGPWPVIRAAVVLTAGFFHAAGATPHQPGSPEQAAREQPVPPGPPAVAGMITRVEPEPGSESAGIPTAPPEGPEQPADDRARTAP